MTFARQTSLFGVFVAMLLSQAVPSGYAQAGASNSPFSRIVVIGASVSAGFTETELFGGPRTEQLRLHHYLEAALTVPHAPVTNLANALFFLSPESDAIRQTGRAAKMNPSLVVAVDFLFWFCYGDMQTEQERLDQFEKGLKLLERFDSAVVVGDIPDASAAIRSGMLRPEQVPSAKTIQAANARLTAWAAKRPRVSIVSVSAFLRHAVKNRAMTIQKLTLPAGTTRALLQSDLLHATSRGCAALALAVLDSVHSTDAARHVRWNVDDVLKRGHELAQHRVVPPQRAPVPPAGK